MKTFLVTLFTFFTFFTNAQERKTEPFKGSDRIVIVNSNDAKTNFKAVINTLLNNGYSIETKDEEYLTIKTQPRSTKSNSTYFFNLWSKDSLIILTGMFDPNIEAGDLIKVKSTFNNIKHGGMSGSEYRKTFAIMKTFAELLPGSIFYEKI